jgi:predicted transcriptional regulator of viral defense system
LTEKIDAPVHSKLAGWVDSRQAQGLYFFSREEAVKNLQMTEIAFKMAVSRLQKKERVQRILSGFYIIVPLEFSSTRVLPADWFIADLMAHMRRPYYVGLLTAAAIHGAAHQQPQQFQVVTTGPLRRLQVRNLSVRFFSKRNFEATPIVSTKVQTGFIPVSTPEGTAIDLIRYARAIGGLDRVLTVLQELGETMDRLKLVSAVEADGNLAYGQRLGWLLDKAGHSALVEGLLEWISGRSPLLARLEPSLPIRGAKKDPRWQLLINTEVEADL